MQSGHSHGPWRANNLRLTSWGRGLVGNEPFKKLNEEILNSINSCTRLHNIYQIHRGGTCPRRQDGGMPAMEQSKDPKGFLVLSTRQACHKIYFPMCVWLWWDIFPMCVWLWIFKRHSFKSFHIEASLHAKTMEAEDVTKEVTDILQSSTKGMATLGWVRYFTLGDVCHLEI